MAPRRENSPRCLTERGFGASRLTICEHLGGPREKVRAVSARDFALDDVDALNTIALDLVADRDAQNPVARTGLAGSIFSSMTARSPRRKSAR